MRFYERRSLPSPLRHAANSGAILQLRDSHLDIVRPGVLFYGGDWMPQADARVVTLPVGYGEGYTRAMSGKAEVIIHGKRYPVVGRICMDQVMVALGRASAYNGDEVVVLGGARAATISIEEMAAWAGTIPHEVLTSINSRVPRVYRGG